MPDAEFGTPEEHPASTSDTRVPPIGIKHLLLFTTFAAVIFAIEKASDYWSSASPNMPQTMLVARQTSSLMHAMIAAAAATGLVALLQTRDANGRILRASGHWMVLRLQ